jgi:hypothetical protein
MPFFTFSDTNGIEHESYEAACHYYGAEIPAQLAAEFSRETEESWIYQQDDMEARGGPMPMLRLDNEIDWF